MDSQFTNESSFREPPKKNSSTTILGIIAIIVIAFFVIKFIKGNSYISTVKEGYLTNYPSLSIGTAFERFFSKPEWEYLKTEDNDDAVNFTGVCLLNGLSTELAVQFIFYDKESFELYAVEADGVPQSRLDIQALLEAVYE